MNKTEDPLDSTSNDCGWLAAAIQEHNKFYVRETTHRGLYSFAIERLEKIAGAKQTLSKDEAQILKDQLASLILDAKELSFLFKHIDKATEMRSLDDIFTSKHVGSIEMMMTLVTPFVASLCVPPSLEDPDLVYLYQQILIAFHRKRTTLAFTFASSPSPTLHSLPWIQAIHAALQLSTVPSPMQQVETTGYCKSLVINTLRSFGETPLENVFIAELNLAMRFAGLTKPCALVKGINQDNGWTGGLHKKYTVAYEVAHKCLDDTIYQRYYCIEKHPVTQTQSDASDVITALCRSRIGLSHSTMLLEQSQILTTHNMATLFIAFDLHGHLCELNILGILRRGLIEISRRATQLRVRSPSTWRLPALTYQISGLWRQIMFFLAVLEKYDRAQFADAIELLKHESRDLFIPEFRVHFQRVEHVAEKESHHDCVQPPSEASGSAVASLPYLVSWGIF